LDVVLGFGAHPDPASELAPVVARAKAKAQDAGRYLEVVAVVSGTDEDPQDLNAQIQQLKDAGAVVDTSNERAVSYVGRLLKALNPDTDYGENAPFADVGMALLNQPLAAINVGLESFAESLKIQNAKVIQVDWRPPASGDEKIMSILERMRRK